MMRNSPMGRSSEAASASPKAQITPSGLTESHQLQDGRGYVQDATPGVLPVSAALLITHFAGWWHAIRYYVWNPPNIHHGGHHAKHPSPGTLHSPVPIPLVTPMDRYARSWMLFLQTNVCASERTPHAPSLMLQVAGHGHAELLRTPSTRSSGNMASPRE